MYCSDCGKQIEEGVVFCRFCGHKVTGNEFNSQSESSSKKNKTSQPVKKSKKDILWDKFAEVYDAKDDEREKFDKLSSVQIWELIERLYTNAFETFIQEKKKELNSQPYKVIEALKNLYLLAVLGGYRLWIAETLLNKKLLEEFKPFNIDEFVERWKINDFQKAIKELSSEMKLCVGMYSEHRINSFIEDFPSIKEVPNFVMEELRTAITYQILNGYVAGELESKFRK